MDIKDYVAYLPDELLEFISNQALIEEGFESDSEESKSNKAIVKSLNENFEESHFASNEEETPLLVSYRIRSQSIGNAWICDCSTENVKLILI